MNANFAVHPRTKTQLDQLAAAPSHATLFVGPDGIGKGLMAQQAIAEMLHISPEALTYYAYFSHIEPDGASISIETVRSVRQFLRLKTTGEQNLRRAVLIEHAEALTTEAQNALLKMLEEPPADTIIVLTTANVRALLPTIASRVQLFTVHVPGEAIVRAQFAPLAADDTALAQAYFLSGGLPGLMHALLVGGDGHPLAASVATAKDLLRQSTFERLAQVDRLGKQKDETAHVLDALARIAQAGLDQAAAKQNGTHLKQWHHILKETHAARQALATGANTKITLTNLMLQL